MYNLIHMAQVSICLVTPTSQLKQRALAFPNMLGVLLMLPTVPRKFLTADNSRHYTMARLHYSILYLAFFCVPPHGVQETFAEWTGLYHINLAN